MARWAGACELLPSPLLHISLLHIKSKMKAFAFTHNNYTNDTVEYYSNLFANGVADGSIVYGVFGKEVAPTTGTPHLQGYVFFAERRRVGAVRRLFAGAHVEQARASSEHNREYCTKGGDFVEFGSASSCPTQGKRTEFDRFKDWLKAEPSWPSDAHIAENWTSLYGRYGKRLSDLRDLLYPKPVLETEAARDGWQTDLLEELGSDPVDDRKIVFYVDEEGGKGKTWFIRKYLSAKDDGQMFGVGKRDDIAHALDPTKRVFFFNIPRDNMQYLQYGVLESIKDRLVFSPKYCARTKRLINNPHVVVFSNEHPEMNKLTDDRYDIRVI